MILYRLSEQAAVSVHMHVVLLSVHPGMEILARRAGVTSTLAAPHLTLSRSAGCSCAVWPRVFNLHFLMTNEIAYVYWSLD